MAQPAGTQRGGAPERPHTRAQPAGERSGGYLLVQPAARPAYAAAELLLSPSDCLCPRCPDVWALRWVRRTAAERRAAAEPFGVVPERVEALVDWTTRAFDAGVVGWPGVFLEATAAAAFAVRFLPADTDAVLLGLGLPESWATAFLAEAAPGEREGAPGLYEAVRRGAPPAAGGTPLGYELLGYDAGGVHSWLCNGLEREVAAALGVRPNAAGLLATLEDAERAVEHIAREDFGAEPAWWAPWRLTRYPVPAVGRSP